MKTLILILTCTAALFAQTASFPGTVATDATMFNAANNVGSTLLAAQSATDTVAIVVSSAGITPNMLISVGTTKPEIEAVCAVAGNTLTLGYNGVCPSITGRGFDGTAAAAHAAGKASPVNVNLVAWHRNKTNAEITAVETALGANLANLPPVLAFAASTYDFAAQQPAGSLIAGSNTITLTPVPLGVNGSDVGHSLYVSVTGTPEACLINGGSGTSGQPSGSITISCAGAHAAGYSVQSASGGINEAIVALPASGGQVVASKNVTLYANVSDGGKTRVSVARQPGVTIAGSFTVAGSTFTNLPSEETVYSQPNWSSYTHFYSAKRHALGNFPASEELGAWDPLPNAAALVGSAVAPAANTFSNVFGTASFALQYGQRAAVAVYGQASIGAGGAGGIWGGNLGVANYSVASPAGKFANMWGLELDMNISATGAAPGSVFGATAVSAAYKLPSVLYTGFEVEKAGAPGHVHYPFKAAFRSDAGAANVGLSLNPASFVESTLYTYATLPLAVAGFNTVYRCTNCTQATPTAAGGAGALVQGVSGTWDGNPAFGFSQPIQLSGIEPTTGASGLAQITTDGGGNLKMGANSSTGGTAALVFESPLGSGVFSIIPKGSGTATISVILPIYASNALAHTGGLANGCMYSDGAGAVKVVF